MHELVVPLCGSRHCVFVKRKSLAFTIVKSEWTAILPMIPVLVRSLSIVEGSGIAFEGIPAPDSLTGLPER